MSCPQHRGCILYRLTMVSQPPQLKAACNWRTRNPFTQTPKPGFLSCHHSELWCVCVCVSSQHSNKGSEAKRQSNQAWITNTFKFKQCLSICGSSLIIPTPHSHLGCTTYWRFAAREVDGASWNFTWCKAPVKWSNVGLGKSLKKTFFKKDYILQRDNSCLCPASQHVCQDTRLHGALWITWIFMTWSQWSIPWDSTHCCSKLSKLMVVHVFSFFLPSNMMGQWLIVLFESTCAVRSSLEHGAVAGCVDCSRHDRWVLQCRNASKKHPKYPTKFESQKSVLDFTSNFPSTNLHLYDRAHISMTLWALGKPTSSTRKRSSQERSRWQERLRYRWPQGQNLLFQPKKLKKPRKAMFRWRSFGKANFGEHHERTSLSKIMD